MIAAAVGRICFDTQLTWKHCDAEDDCYCIRAVLFLVSSYQASWEHCEVEDDRVVVGLIKTSGKTGSMAKPIIFAAVLEQFLLRPG